ncbi:ATPase of HSP90 chaperone topoisomerase II kinase [Coleophoma crateriformis]|uniref:ATPase of HSP90 chaperone topoisomerase II kinase n=1 Tax=Coleophoma crateriformis TaxID=565419 RepID=A0A3D8R8P9_9HELO|nr:ATPase of HSP90 chaperone topoisomerase II kinase [Coleophoma crateriformis]
MDFSKLRAAALENGDDEEAVTVNTRALIDKVLARYSGEWTTLRELIQNAADAQATTVTIKFETLPSAQIPVPNTTNQSEILKHVLLHHTLKRLVVTNNGQAFGTNDWARLKRIAEGNPDETKIGAFGVGFYSVFADCEDPFVSSGNEAMAFYWKGNSLFTKRLQLPPAEANPNTSFVLDYRNTTTPMPNLLSIAQFLATSLTFVALQNLELWVDDWKIISLQKKVAPSIQVPIAKDVETRTKEGWMAVQSLDRESVQMDAAFMNVVGWKPSAAVAKSGNAEGAYGNSTEIPSLRSFFSRLTSTAQSQQKSKALKEEKAMQEIILEDLTTITTANVFLRVTTAQVKTAIKTSVAAELERATKKPPPKTTKLSILTSSYDETEASTKANAVAKGVNIFASVLPSKKPGGRIFIGFPTHQTTGAGLHLSAPSVIPTVERESIDLNARWVRTWNIEMLRVAGIISRLAFANEMSDLSAKIIRAAEQAGRGTKVSKEEIAQFMPEALHTLKTFTFDESTPSSQVSQIIEEAFWTAYKKPSIEMYSSRGVLPTTKVRLAIDDLSGFVEGIPVVPKELTDVTFVNKLKDWGLLTEITVGDVKQELEAKALDQAQLIQFIGWAGRKAVKGEMDVNTLHSLLDVTVATIEEGPGKGGIITLGTVKNFLQVSKIPADVPIPPTTIPFQFTRGSTVDELYALGWESLDIVPWLRFLIESASSNPDDLNLTKSPKFAAQVLLIVSKQWDSMSQPSKATVQSLFKPITIIPTKFGMKKPGEAFFASVKLFDDLPIVTGCQGVKEKFFSAIGVRKTVDLETIFSRLLVSGDGIEQSEMPVNKRNGHMELIKYLTSVRDEIPVEDMKRLTGSRICPAEAGPKGAESMQGTSKLFQVSELFEPKSELRDLGLPILQWPGPPGSYRASSAEGRFLSLLGLRAWPSVQELVALMASDNADLRQKATTYYIGNHHNNGYASFPIGTIAARFLPLEGDGTRLVSPVECFTNEKCAILGFDILKKDLHLHADKFGVRPNPYIKECINRLIDKPPQSRRDAIPLYTYFSSRLGEIGPTFSKKLSDSQIVPVKPKDESSKEVRLLTPRQCYLGNSSTYGDIFDFVDFGMEANAFLTTCGSKNEPTKLEIAALVAREPARLLGILATPEKYIHVLRTLADDASIIRKDKQLWNQLKTSKCLIAWKQISAPKQPSSEKVGLEDEEVEEEEAPIKTYQLEYPNNIIVVDDYGAFRLFKDKLVCAPEEETLEDFYLALGSSALGNLVEEDLRIGAPSNKQKQATVLQNQILERSKLFLHELPPNLIRYDGKWLEKNLKVEAVTAISLRRSLRGRSVTHKENRSAATSYDRQKGCILYISAEGVDTYQVSQAVCKILLLRPTQQALLSFETLLTLNLIQLRARGYNVERILRQKAAEQRVAEEQRRKQMEEEQRHLKEQEEAWKKESQMVPAAAKEELPRPKEPAMPGAFGADSPPTSPAPKRNRGLLSGLKERFSSGEAQQQLQNFLGGGTGPSHEDHPPPYEDTAVDKPKQGGVEKVSSPHAVQQNLLNAIQSSRAHDSSTLFSPPTQQKVKEQATYCDSTPSQNITYLAEASNGTRIFVSKGLSAPSEFLTENLLALNSFAILLHEVGDVYALPRKSLHIFYDQEGGTIAFNSNGSIFCNFRFFSQLHQKKLEADNQIKEGRMEAASYWWIVIAHELAHNLVKEHNAEHSYYTEMLVANYFTKMMTKAGSYAMAQPARRQIQAPPAPKPEDRSLLD